VRDFQLSERKEWLRYYFVLALGADGRIVDALWHHDPWLTQGDESETQMRAFAAQYAALCRADRQIPLNVRTSIGYSCTVKYGTVNVWIIGHELDITLQDNRFNVSTFTWCPGGRFSQIHGRAWYVNAPVYIDFNAWRSALLAATAKFASGKEFN
jgi:hypothetical protein